MTLQTPLGTSRSVVVTFIAGRAISTLGNNATYLALVFAVLSIGGSPADLGLILAAATVPRIIFTLLGGIAGDTKSRKFLLIGSDLTMAIVQAITATLLLSGACEIWHLAVLQALGGAAAAYSTPAQSGIMPLLARPQDLIRYNSYFRSAKNVGAVVGPALGGLLITFSSPGTVLALDAATFLASAVMMARLPHLPAVSTPTKLWADLKPGFREARSRSWVGAMIVSFSLYQATVLPAIMVVGPLLSPAPAAATWAAILVARSFGGLLGPLLLVKIRVSRPLAIGAAALLLDVPFLIALAMGAWLPLICVLAAFSSSALLMSDVLWETALQEEIPPEYLSRVMSLDWLGSLAVAPLGYVFVGYLTENLSAMVVIVLVIVAHVATRAAILAVPSVRGFRTKPRSADELGWVSAS